MTAFQDYITKKNVDLSALIDHQAYGARPKEAQTTSSANQSSIRSAGTSEPNTASASKPSHKDTNDATYDILYQQLKDIGLTPVSTSRTITKVQQLGIELYHALDKNAQKAINNEETIEILSVVYSAPKLLEIMDKMQQTDNQLGYRRPTLPTRMKSSFSSSLALFRIHNFFIFIPCCNGGIVLNKCFVLILDTVY